MTKLDRLGGALKEVEAPLGRALQEHSPFMGLIDSDLQLSTSQCGMATAALQLYLASQCGIVTYRQIAVLPMLSMRRHPDDPVKHVMLHTDDARGICPTYTHFFELVGLNTRVAQESPEMKALLPERKIALINEADEIEFGRAAALDALRIREKVTPVIAGRALDFMTARSALLRRADDATVISAYQSIWRSQDYEPYTVESQTVRYGDDEFEACIRDIVDAI